jgi:Family of unknown function (DUF5906)
MTADRWDSFIDPADVAEAATKAKSKPRAKGKSDNALPIADFVAHSPDHTYIYRPTRETWSKTAVNSRVPPMAGGKKPISASTWLDRNDAVAQRTWAPGEPEIITDRLISEGGFFPKPEARVFNLYKPPTIIRAAGAIALWRDHLRLLWSDEADHIERWMAQRVQHPGVKINHALVLGGKQGIGKDFTLEPLKRAIGPWNVAEISPQAVLGNFNDFARSVVLRISEGKDLGKIDRFAFYEATKTLIAAPPDTLRVNPKFVTPYYILNVVGVIITTNHKAAGLFLPADDRRHFVAWSTVEPIFAADFWSRRWAWLEKGGAEAVADHLARLDLSAFDPKAPTPHTQAFWEIVNAMRAVEESEMADVIELLGRPPTLIVLDLIREAEFNIARFAEFLAFLRDRKNSRLVTVRFEECGYRRLANPGEQTGRWNLVSGRTGVYVRAQMTDREGFSEIRSRRDYRP